VKVTIVGAQQQFDVVWVASVVRVPLKVELSRFGAGDREEDICHAILEVELDEVATARVGHLKPVVGDLIEQQVLRIQSGVLFEVVLGREVQLSPLFEQRVIAVLLDVFWIAGVLGTPSGSFTTAFASLRRKVANAPLSSIVGRVPSLVEVEAVDARDHHWEIEVFSHVKLQRGDLPLLTQ